jgi:ESCRT-II complex subunit VPS36
VRRRQGESGVMSNNDPAPSDSETTFIRSSLARLGLPTDAVTQDMVADEKAYHVELAKELGGLLLGGYGGKGGKAREPDKRGIGVMRHSRGIVGLDEVWGAWNRARGIGE